MSQLQVQAFSVLPKMGDFPDIVRQFRQNPYPALVFFRHQHEMKKPPKKVVSCGKLYSVGRGKS